jgi:hypothetical protein
MPTRSAIVGFSVDTVYAIAELIRRTKGGCAVVMGALSPRTRNAQVELYQNGDVDYLVATDAIGMGLNLDIRHVAFAATAKYDGRRMRPLFPHEIGQIAGRAGRHTDNGSFGVTGEARPFDEELIDAIEHRAVRRPPGGLGTGRRDGGGGAGSGAGADSGTGTTESPRRAASAGPRSMASPSMAKFQPPRWMRRPGATT